MAHAAGRPDIASGARGRAARPELGRGRLAGRTVRVQRVRCREGRTPVACVPPPVHRPDADRPAGGRPPKPRPAGVGDRHRPDPADAVQRGPRPAAGGEGRRGSIRGRRHPGEPARGRHRDPGLRDAGLARVGAIMKRLQSTETLGSTSAINSDKTGTLTLNQMTAVQMALVGRRYTIEGKGYAADGPITRVAGEGEIPLDDFLLPMVLASDAVVSDGELIGDPTEGALVVLAVKGGVDAVSTRQAYPRLAELPFDAAYKLMATFHRMNDDAGRGVIRCYVKG